LIRSLADGIPYTTTMSGETIYIYTTTTGGSVIVHKNERAQGILAGIPSAKDRIKVVYLDIEQEKRQKVWDISGKRGVYPLIFVGEKFIGELDDLEEQNENETLASLLG